MQLVSDLALALVPPEGVDALVLAAVALEAGALVVLLHEGGREAGLLDGGVGDEADVEVVGGGLEVGGHLVAAELTEEGGVGGGAVADLDEVVDAVVVVLDLCKDCVPINFRKKKIDGAPQLNGSTALCLRFQSIVPFSSISLYLVVKKSGKCS